MSFNFIFLYERKEFNLEQKKCLSEIKSRLKI